MRVRDETGRMEAIEQDKQGEKWRSRGRMRAMMAIGERNED